jgi:hypothetical protein
LIYFFSFGTKKSITHGLGNPQAFWFCAASVGGARLLPSPNLFQGLVDPGQWFHTIDQGSAGASPHQLAENLLVGIPFANSILTVAAGNQWAKQSSLNRPAAALTPSQTERQNELV